jgi:hypothetical protein
LAPESRIITGLTEAQCHYLEQQYDHILKQGYLKDYRYSACIDADGKG